MLTYAELYVSYNFVLKVVCPLALVPYDFEYNKDSMTFEIQSTTSKFKNFTYNFLSVAPFLYFPFNVYQFNAYYLRWASSKKDLETVILIFFFLIARWQGAWLNVVYWKHREGISRLLRAQQSLNVAKGIKLLDKLWRDPNRFSETLLKSLIAAFYALSTFTTLCFVVMKNGPWYIYSVLPPGSLFSPIYFPMLLILEAGLVIQMAGAFTVILLTEYYHFSSCNFWIDFVLARLNEESKSGLSQPALTEALHTYRCFQIMNNIHNNVLSGVYITGYLLTVTSFFAFAAYITIRCSKTLSMSIYFLFPLLVCVTSLLGAAPTLIMSQKYEKSTSFARQLHGKLILLRPAPTTMKLPSIRTAIETIQSQRKTKMETCLKQTIHSLAPLKGWVGDFYYVRNSSKLVYFGLVINIVANLLLTF